MQPPGVACPSGIAQRQVALLAPNAIVWLLPLALSVLPFRWSLIKMFLLPPIGHKPYEKQTNVQATFWWWPRHTHTHTQAPTLGQISQVSDVSMNQPVKSLVNANSSSDLWYLLAFHAGQGHNDCSHELHSACGNIRNTCHNKFNQVMYKEWESKCLDKSTDSALTYTSLWAHASKPAENQENFIKYRIWAAKNCGASAQLGCSPHPMSQ